MLPHNDITSNKRHKKALDEEMKRVKKRSDVITTLMRETALKREDEIKELSGGERVEKIFSQYPALLDPTEV